MKPYQRQIFNCTFITSYERDSESDLDFAQARYYAKNLGRFTTADPTLSSMSPTEPKSFNKYVYVLNNPLSYTDPLGLYTCTGSSDECKAFEDQRLNMENKLAKMKDKKSKEYEKLQRAINAYGKAGVDNGVTVQFGTNAQGKPLNTVGGIRDNDGDFNKDVTDTNPTGQNTVVTVDLAQLGGLKNLDTYELATALSHEGSHVADIAALVNEIPLTYADSSGNFTKNAMKVLQSDMNNRYASEVLAYQLSIVATQALGYNQFSLGSGKDKTTIWQSDWGNSENKKTRQNIDKRLAVPKDKGGYGLDKVNKGQLIPY